MFAKEAYFKNEKNVPEKKAKRNSKSVFKITAGRWLLQ